jgi:hypothetical protein
VQYGGGLGDSQHVHVHVQLGGIGMCRCQIAFLFHVNHHTLHYLFSFNSLCGIIVEGK